MFTVVCTLLVAFIVSVDSQASEPPLFPEDWSASFYQQKWNINVNHTGTGVWYNSGTQYWVRVDMGTQEFGVNEQRTTSSLITLLDFNNNKNYLRTIQANGTQICQIYTIEGYFLPKPTFLKDAKAVWAGLVDVDKPINYGECERWTVWLGQTAITFFFDAQKNFVRWDLVSPDLQTGVNTYYWDLTVRPQEASLFKAGSDCIQG